MSCLGAQLLLRKPPQGAFRQRDLKKREKERGEEGRRGDGEGAPLRSTIVSSTSRASRACCVDNGCEEDGAKK
eukprot:170474-Pyramimonas_sp.AAC.1